MPSWTLLIAIFLAFADQPAFGSKAAASGSLTLTVWDWAVCLVQVVGGSLAVSGGAAIAGWLAARGAEQRRKLPRAARFYLVHSHWIVDWLILATFAWIIYGVGWPKFVLRGLGLENAILADEVLILAPFLAGQMLSWVGLHYGALALRRRRGGSEAAVPSLRGELGRRFRQSMAVGLSMTIALALIQDLAFQAYPEGRGSSTVQFALMIAVAVLSLCATPILLRWCWPSRPLPEGPLRDRLQRMARRFGFRCADILIWETGGQFCTAAVAGAFPRFRYVFLTDVLVDQLDDEQIEAVFGHEIGHVYHSHVSFFSIFLLGSLCLMGVVSVLSQSLMDWLIGGVAEMGMAMIFARGIELTLAACWFFAAFGSLSRRFERQADLFACRTLSCGRETCPDDSDANAHEAFVPTAKRDLPAPCPRGIEVFASALRVVADWNGVRLDKWSWRHGRMQDRINFLQSLRTQPELAGRFEARLRTVRLATGLGMGAVFVLAVWLDAFGSGLGGF